jgi:4a-hydroxytetrahydrobiopterin dehydratase
MIAETVHESPLALRQCMPCKGGVPPLRSDALKDYQQQLGGGWIIVEDHHLQKDFRFPDFRSALEFVNRVGELADEVNHHPDIRLSWGKVGITLWTHKIGGLSETDFVFAAKVDMLPRGA